MTIWKYQIPMVDKFTICMPKRARILSVQAQHNDGMFWALVDPEEPPEDRIFYLVRTGFDVPPEAGEYIGTYQQDGGTFIWHLFEARP